MDIKLVRAEKSDDKKIKKLYKNAFPAEERAPYFFLRNKARCKKGEMLAAKDGEEFVGFVYLVCQSDMVYLFYFAVDAEKRGKSYGGKILSCLHEMYKGKRLFLAREQMDEQAENYEQRVKRHEFYLHNGFVDLPCKIKEASVVYDVMSNGEMISAEEYNSLISAWAGRFVRKMIDMKIVD